MENYTERDLRTILENVSPENKEKLEFCLVSEQYDKAAKILHVEIAKMLPRREAHELNFLLKGYSVGGCENVEQLLEKTALSEEEKRRILNLYNSHLSVSSFVPFQNLK